MRYLVTGATGFIGNRLARQLIEADHDLRNPTDMLKERRNRWVNAFGRLKPGVSQQQAKAALQPFMHSMLEQEVQEAAFAHASTYDRQEFLKCWIDVLPGSQGQQPSDAAVALMLPSSRSADRNASRP